MKIGIFISGSGTNMEAVLANFKKDYFSGVDDISFVLSDKKDAGGLKKAALYGVNCIVLEKIKGESRAEHEKRMLDAIAAYGVGLLVLAGFMRILSPYFIRNFKGKIINIHPSLLPSFPGIDAQIQAYDHGVKVTGCTTHFVDESLDGGPIILQNVVERLSEDTPEDLRQRILAQEHKLLSETIELVTCERYVVNDRYIKLEKNHEA